MLAAAIGLAGVASAQTDYTPTNLSVRLGVGFPLDDVTRDITKTLIGVGVDYDFTRPLIAGGDTFLSIDWFGKSGSGAHGNIFPIMINQRFYSQPIDVGNRRTYGFLGVGIAVLDVFNTKTVLAARGGVGVELGQNLFAEGTLYLSAPDQGVRANVVGLYVGYKF